MIVLKRKVAQIGRGQLIDVIELVRVGLAPLFIEGFSNALIKSPLSSNSLEKGAFKNLDHRVPQRFKSSH